MDPCSLVTFKEHKQQNMKHTATVFMLNASTERVTIPWSCKHGVYQVKKILPTPHRKTRGTRDVKLLTNTSVAQR